MEWLVGILLIFLVYVILVSSISEPVVNEITIPKRVEISENHYQIGNNWLQKNEFGVWEMYIEGDDYERGLIYGELAKELVQKQEQIFVKQIDDFVPNAVMQRFLQLMIGFFNKDLPTNIPEENIREIYGVSKSFSDDYNYISTKFGRILNYHAAHDIGHALNDYSIVGCTSFALNGEKTADGKLLVGRNFDFYVGDDFAKEKIVLFVNPTKGYSFASYSWAGFTGVVSGMNDQGLSVTINASKSDVPTSTKTPISLVAREIVQYAKTIDEAIAIAKKRAVFVSESIMVSSKIDGKAGLIEKSPTGTGVYFSPTNTLICSNHFQSDIFKNTVVNQQNKQLSDSDYRYKRTQELIDQKSKLTVNDAVAILRNQRGINNEYLGMGNPKAINQLIAHHSIVFQPNELKCWISTTDFQLGAFVEYDLKEIFRTQKINPHNHTIAPDIFVKSTNYKNFKRFKILKQAIFRHNKFGEKLILNNYDIQQFIATNPKSYLTYEVLGDYFNSEKNMKQAIFYYQKALKFPVASLNVKSSILARIKACRK